MRPKAITAVIIAPVALMALFALSLPQGVYARHVCTGDKSTDDQIDRLLKPPHSCWTPPDSILLPNFLEGTNNITDLLDNVTNWLLLISVPIVGIVVVIGAYQMLFARGEPEKFKTGTQTIWYAVIAFIILLVAAGVADLIRSILNAK
jgi:hypothetical protein